MFAHKDNQVIFTIGDLSHIRSWFFAIPMKEEKIERGSSTQLYNLFYFSEPADQLIIPEQGSRGLVV